MRIECPSYCRCGWQVGLGAVTYDCDRAVEGHNSNDDLAEEGIDSETFSLESSAEFGPLVLGHF
jgi:hypothetical protein